MSNDTIQAVSTVSTSALSVTDSTLNPSRAKVAGTELPFLSVVMPVRNEARHLARTVEQLLAQDYPEGRFEILIVDGYSTDETRDIAETLAARHPNIRVLDNPRRLSSGARNVGIREARGESVVIIDGHCEIPKADLLRQVAAAFERSGADCLGRPQPLDVTGATTLQRAIAAARSSQLGHHPASFIYSNVERFVPAKSVAVAYRRAVFDQVGSFDERFDACEDVELNHRIDRAGLRCYFTPKIAVRYQPRLDLRGLFRQMIRYARGRVRLLRKHPETFSIPCFVPAVFVLGLLVGPGLAMLSTPLAIIFGGALALYASLVLGVSMTIAARSGQRSLLPWLPLVFATIHVGTGVGVLQEAMALVFRRHSVLGSHEQMFVRCASRSSK